MQIITDIKQGSDEWHALRCGVVTASRFKDVLAGGQGKTRAKYMMDICAELLTSLPAQTYSNEYMEWGTQTEPQAISTYEFDKDVDVQKVSFIRRNDRIGCSPDGLIANDGIIEVKCPKTTTQIETYLSGKMPTIHKPQVQGCLWIAEREWCDFISFDPRIDGPSSFFVDRIYRDEDYIKTLSDACNKFIDEIEETLDKLR